VGQPSLELRLDDLGCDVFDSFSCSAPIASPSASSFTLSVFNWGSNATGSIELSDNCGGRFSAPIEGVNNIQGFWLPPVAGGVCIVTGRATNGDGAVGTVRAAVLVRPGTPATSAPPLLSVSLEVNVGFCQFETNDPAAPADCGTLPPGGFVRASIFSNWLDGTPGSLEITDDCGGGRTEARDSLSTLFRAWQPMGESGAVCTVTVRGVSLQGVEGVATGRFTLE
jgi:hypothetical protein